MLWKFGSSVLDKDVLILNMGSATRCPAKARGLCKLNNKCYALHSEIQYTNTLRYRERQAKYWLHSGAEKIAQDLIKSILRRRLPTRYFRFNESGDFYSQSDITKLNYIAKRLKELNIITFGYSARSDLNFNDTEFIVRGSGFMLPHGMTIICDSNTPSGYNEELNATVCSKDCKTCMLTRTLDTKIIAMPLRKRGRR
jgi:hypothetical protein